VNRRNSIRSRAAISLSPSLPFTASTHSLHIPSSFLLLLLLLPAARLLPPTPGQTTRIANYTTAAADHLAHPTTLFQTLLLPTSPLAGHVGIPPNKKRKEEKKQTIKEEEEEEEEEEFVCLFVLTLILS
jgi:hypothetical protein